MKIESPPKFKSDYSKYFESIKKVDCLSFIHETDSNYWFWSELKRRPDIPFRSPKTTWEIIKLHRSISAKHLTLGEHSFHYNITSSIQKELHLFDLKLIGGLYKDSISPQDQEEYFKTSLIEEAIASSQIEGAATTTRVALELLKTGRRPRNESEQMILNNYAAIREITTRLKEPLGVQLIIDIHELMTSNTDASRYAGNFRDHPIYVKDLITGDIAFTAPKFPEVNGLVEQLLVFINNEDDFIHPILKASILHFLIGYIHPFGDGNGRTARALYYWFLIKKGYSLLRHISISKAILESRTSYDKAFLYTELDQNDLTYFIIYSMKSLRVAFQNLVDYRDKKRDQRMKATKFMSILIDKGFSKRQSELLGFLLLKPNSMITITDYSKRHDIVRQTASRDLTELEDKGLLIKTKDGKSLSYQLSDIEKLKKLVKH